MWALIVSEVASVFKIIFLLNDYRQRRCAFNFILYFILSILLKL